MNDITAPRVAVADLPIRQVKDVRELLVNKHAMGQLQKVAAKHMNPERMMRVMANAMRTTPKLAECDPMSMLGALMSCAALGLEPNTPLGHAYLIPFENKRKGVVEVQMIIGYKGFADLARRSGQVQTLHADVVYDDDDLWSYEFGTDTHLRHKPGPRAGKMTHAYCHVKLDGGQAFVVLPIAEVLRIRDQSQGWKTAVKYGKKDSNPWGSHFERMAAKTAVRALANRGELPLSIEFMEAMEADDAKPDFAAFAMNPDDGMTIDAQVEDDDQSMVEDDKAPVQQQEAQKEESKPAQAKAETKTADLKPDQKQEANKPADDQATGEAQSPAKDKPDNRRAMQDAYNTIMADVMDVGPGKAKIAHAKAIREMLATQPDLHAKLVDDIEAFGTGGEGEGE